MKELSKSYRKNGYDYKQVRREGMIAIYEQVNPDDGKTVGFEVFEIITRPDREINGKAVKANESVPPERLWGSIAFTSGNMEQANKRFEYIRTLIAGRGKDG